MGSYINNNLVKDERVELETKHHWIIFFSLGSFFTLFISPLIAMNSNEFAITNKRIIIKTGLLSRKTLEMNLSKIESVNIEQGIFARMLGYGTLRVIGTGGTKEAFPAIKDPISFRNKFQELSA